MAVTAHAELSRITIIPGQRSDHPCIRDLRITVQDIRDMLATGLTEDEILADYPYLEKRTFQQFTPTASHNLLHTPYPSHKFSKHNC